MRLLMAVVNDPEGRVESEPVTVQVIAGVVALTLDDGTCVEFDEVELQGALFDLAHEAAA